MIVLKRSHSHLSMLHLHGVDGATSDEEHWNGWELPVLVLSAVGDRTSDNPLSRLGLVKTFRPTVLDRVVVWHARSVSPIEIENFQTCGRVTIDDHKMNR